MTRSGTRTCGVNSVTSASAAGRHLIGQRIDPQETVGLRKGRDRAGALAGRDRRSSHPTPSTSDTMTNSVRPSSEAIRTGTLARDLGIGTRRQAGHPPQHRHDHVVEGEHRRGRKSRQDDDRLAVADRKTQRLARLQRDAMGDDAGLAEPRDDAVGDVARAFEVPPDSTSMSLVSSASRIAASSCASSSAIAPRNTASPPFSLIAAVTIAPLVS